MHIYFDNALRFIRRRTDEYDLIIVDSTDPFGPSESYFTKEFYGICYNALHEDWNLLNQQGSRFISTMQKRCSAATSGSSVHFQSAECIRHTSRPMRQDTGSLGSQAKKYHPLDDLDAEKWQALNLKTNYYTTRLHKGAF